MIDHEGGACERPSVRPSVCPFAGSIYVVGHRGVAAADEVTVRSCVTETTPSRNSLCASRRERKPLVRANISKAFRDAHRSIAISSTILQRGELTPRGTDVPLNTSFEFFQSIEIFFFLHSITTGKFVPSFELLFIDFTFFRSVSPVFI